ncbi:hypothetical protein [Sphaerisporangium rhizosphaerae]|uniref:Uncharacterized protein n=1 Tax=Sphaerisporangium rhizosphaerae TaxID=2269375 RepID=A0ABW2NX69_9ACTN
MFVTYKPEDGDEQRWEFNPKRVRASKAEMIEKRAGENWDAWLASLQSGNMRARRVLLWHLLTVDHPTFRWEDVPDFYASELMVEHSVAELTEIRDRVTKAKLPADQVDQILSALDGEIASAMEREQVSEPAGKARSKSVA